MNASRDPLVLFMPSGKRGRFPVGTPVLDAARQLGVYVESVCGGRATCGRCQVEVQEGNFAKHKIVSSNDHISPNAAPRKSATPRCARLPESRRLSCSAHDPGRPRHRRAAGHRRQRRRSCARGRQRPRHRAQCRRAALLRRGRRARHAQAARRSRPPEGHAGEGLGLQKLDLLVGLPPDRRRCRRSCARRTGASPPPSTATTKSDRAAHHRALAGPAERGLRHRLRHRLDDHRHASRLAAVGPHRRLGRHVQPADPLRRRPDEPRLLRDDEPGRPRRHDRRRARGDQRADRQGLRGRRRRRATTCSTCVFVGNPIMHHLFLGIDPTELGRRPFALAVSGATAAAGRIRDRHQGQCRARASTCCPASPAMSARTRPARRCRKARTARTR